MPTRPTVPPRPLLAAAALLLVALVPVQAEHLVLDEEFRRWERGDPAPVWTEVHDGEHVRTLPVGTRLGTRLVLSPRLAVELLVRAPDGRRTGPFAVEPGQLTRLDAAGRERLARLVRVQAPWFRGHVEPLASGAPEAASGSRPDGASEPPRPTPHRHPALIWDFRGLGTDELTPLHPEIESARVVTTGPPLESRLVLHLRGRDEPVEMSFPSGEHLWTERFGGEHAWRLVVSGHGWDAVTGELLLLSEFRSRDGFALRTEGYRERSYLADMSAEEAARWLLVRPHLSEARVRPLRVVRRGHGEHRLEGLTWGEAGWMGHARERFQLLELGFLDHDHTRGGGVLALDHHERTWGVPFWSPGGVRTRVTVTDLPGGFMVVSTPLPSDAAFPERCATAVIRRSPEGLERVSGGGSTGCSWVGPGVGPRVRSRHHPGSEEPPP